MALDLISVGGVNIAIRLCLLDLLLLRQDKNVLLPLSPPFSSLARAPHSCKPFLLHHFFSSPSRAPDPCRYGLLQTSFYFGHITIVCASIAIVCGSVGFLGSRSFVERIYANVKGD